MQNKTRVLIFGQSFNDFSGGGITISNLFGGWEKDNIAVICLPYYLRKYSTNVCDKYYQLGREEYRWKFPLNIIKQSYESGQVFHRSNVGSKIAPVKSGIKAYFSTRFLDPFLKWSGLIHCVSSISLSDRLKEWLNDFKPDVLYMQVSDREGVLFAQNLTNHLRKPSAIHIMDDWPSAISSHGLLKQYWYKKIDKEFRLLLGQVDLCLSISDAMSAEYLSRYKKKFRAFHNPVNTDLYDLPQPAKPLYSGTCRILYIGRIGVANRHSIRYFASIVSKLAIDGKRTELHIISKDSNQDELVSIGKLENVTVKPAVPHENVPALLIQYDLLLLPLDFTEDGLRFARFSIPTKASEYFISGTPVIVFAPGESAISKFCCENDCGCCITEMSEESILNALTMLTLDKAYRTRITSNAAAIAKQLFDGERVCREFQELLINLTRHSIKKAF